MPDATPPAPADIDLRVSATRAGEAAALAVVRSLIPKLPDALEDFEITELGIKGRIKAPGGATATATLAVTIADS